jgi:hypothetical protein
LPLSSIALRTALMRLARVESETFRPCQTLANHPVPVSKQKFQNIEDLRLQFDDALAGAQLALVDIEREIVEDVNHFNRRSTGRPAIQASLSAAILFPIAGRDLPSRPRDENQSAVKPLSRPPQSTTNAKLTISVQLSRV